MTDALDAAALFAARFLVCASFTLLYLYTPELLPTRVSGCDAVQCASRAAVVWCAAGRLVPQCLQARPATMALLWWGPGAQVKSVAVPVVLAAHYESGVAQAALIP